jgi:DNA-binding IclR family transcriptional regulator
MAAAKSCRKIEVLIQTDTILNVFQAVKAPVSVTDISRMTGLSVDSCFRQIGTMEDLRWVEKIGDGYILGMRLAMIWARRKSLAECKLEDVQRELDGLTTGGQE